MCRVHLYEIGFRLIACSCYIFPVFSQFFTPILIAEILLLEILALLLKIDPQTAKERWEGWKSGTQKWQSVGVLAPLTHFTFKCDEFFFNFGP